MKLFKQYISIMQNPKNYLFLSALYYDQLEPSFNVEKYLQKFDLIACSKVDLLQENKLIENTFISFRITNLGKKVLDDFMGRKNSLYSSKEVEEFYFRDKCYYIGLEKSLYLLNDTKSNFTVENSIFTRIEEMYISTFWAIQSRVGRSYHFAKKENKILLFTANKGWIDLSAEPFNFIELLSSNADAFIDFLKEDLKVSPKDFPLKQFLRSLENTTFSTQKYWSKRIEIWKVAFNG